MATAPTSTATDMTPRLFRLFHQAGLLAEAEIKAHTDSTGRNRNLIDILQADASLNSLRELALYEIPLPFRQKKTAAGLTGQLDATPELEDAELIEMLCLHRPRLDVMGKQLLDTGVVERDELLAALQKADEMEKDPYEWLVRQGIVTPRVVASFLRAPNNPLVAQTALFTALSILEQNRIVTPELFRSLVERLSAGSLRPSEARAAIELSPEALIEKLQGGIFLPEVALGARNIEPKLAGLFSHGFVRRQLIVPVAEDEHSIGVAIADPLNVLLAVLLRWLTGRWMQPFYAPSSAIIDKLNALSGGAEEAPAKQSIVQPPPAAAAKPAAEAPAPAKPARGKGGKAAEAKASAPKIEMPKPSPVKMLRPGEAPDDSLSAVQLVSSLVESAIDLHATDIHLEPTKASMVVRFRIDGQLTKILTIPPNLVGPVTARVKVLANMNVTERRRPQDGHIMLDMNDRHFDFRVATVPTIFGEKVAIRILDSARVMSGMGDLGMSEKQREVAERMIRRPHGIILVTGPTGSGKTSTLYAALQEINSESRHLVTIEDPVEYQLNGVNQIHVNPEIGLTFSEGLRAILRQDPNIVMVGEIRDADTAKVAIRAALTGHLVFSTLHTNTAVAAIQALLALGASSFMIGSALSGVIAQRLVRKLCENCKKLQPVPKGLAKDLGYPAGKTVKLMRPVGCEECLNTGYSGRLGIFEVVEMTENLRNAVMSGESPSKLIQISDKDGRIPLHAAGLEKVKAGLTSPEELVEKVLLDA